jgi:hypothetical protein
MCITEEVNDLIGQLEACDDPEEKRTILEAADACGKCKKNGDALNCGCRISFRTELKNINYTLAHRQI